MELPSNPFYTLYLTEGVSEADMPALFSPILVPHVLQLFLPGNVVVRGMQGTGKSMLLSLLDTKVRMQFLKLAGVVNDSRARNSYPVPPSHRNFIGASINLSKSDAIQLRGIKISNDPKENGRLTCSCFSDFVNCWVLRDLITNIEYWQNIDNLTDPKNCTTHLAEVGITADRVRFQVALTSLASHPSCDFLPRGGDSTDVKNALTTRIRAFKRFVMNPRNQLPESITSSFSILGEPLSAATQALREAGVIQSNTNVIVTLDQFEVLVRTSPYQNDADRTQEFVRVVDELIANRDQCVSYRIGTRPNTQLHLSDASRDYVLVDMDQIFRRTESGRKGRNSLFYRFAEDALRRRIRTSQATSCRKLAKAPHPIVELFGVSPKQAQRAIQSAPSNPLRAIKVDKEWQDEVQAYLRELAVRDVLSAKLGEAWVRQSYGSAKSINKPISPEEWSRTGIPAWEVDERAWWRKERLPLATLQIAASNAQQLQYSGDLDILRLSGLNILVFISICREIWECNSRYLAIGLKPAQQELVVPIEAKRQAEGIRDASKQWRQKISASPDGDSLQRLIDILGQKLHEQLINDRQMSYPGANGFSLAARDLDQHPWLKRLLDAATAECYLIERDHTPKTIGRGKSFKWYLHPILSPHYGLTVPHTKEPLYLTASKLISWFGSSFDNLHLKMKTPNEARPLGNTVNNEIVEDSQRPKSHLTEDESDWKQQSLWPDGDV